MIRIRRTCQLVGVLFLATATSVAIVSTAQADPAGAQSELTALSGAGAGMVIISPTSANQGSFDARVKVNIHDTAPNTHFIVTAGGGDAVLDGICTGAPPSNQVATLDTSSGGAGAVEFERSNPNSLSGLRFEVMLRVTGSDGTVLQSGCMIITVK
jgi:hypothetical protein